MTAKERSIGWTRIFVYYFLKYIDTFPMSGCTQLVHKDNTPKNNPLRARMMAALVTSKEARHHSSMLEMATGKIRADTRSRYPYPRAKNQARAHARYPPRAENRARARYPRIAHARGHAHVPA